MKSISLLLLSLVLSFPAFPQGSVSIVKPGSMDSSFDFSGFSASGGAPAEFFNSLRKNLSLPVMFKEAPPSSADFRVLGSAVLNGGKVDVTVQLVGRGQSQSRYGKRFSIDARQVGSLARKVSDEIYQDLTKRPGFASKPIVLVGQRQGDVAKDLYIVYPDGGGMMQLTRDRAAVLSPQWAPDGASITYTSFRNGFPDIYQQQLSPAKRRKISSASGMNSGGSISPDGRKIALILSKDGKPELYVKNLSTGGMLRMTNTPMSAKSSPSWSPDGRQIVFVSGHQGIPNLYVISANGGQPKRITRGGGQNLSPKWGKNGLIVYTSRRSGLFQTAIIDPNSGKTYFVSPQDADYEDPSWAADGYHLVASRTIRGQSSLYLLDMQGKGAKSLLQVQGNWYMPHWRP
ncbi:DPP IV N-terminal domain-containing protein [Kiritimatiellaeota bacterium B1221]|nr:DPP IV N-terminal domain-containing protein [Kiritimatiellaeota bacterium B1221]